MTGSPDSAGTHSSGTSFRWNTSGKTWHWPPSLQQHLTSTAGGSCRSLGLVDVCNEAGDLASYRQALSSSMLRLLFQTRVHSPLTLQQPRLLSWEVQTSEGPAPVLASVCACVCLEESIPDLKLICWISPVAYSQTGRQG